MKRILAIALSLCMMITLMPMNVAMADTEKPVPQGVFVGYDDMEEQLIVSVKEDKRNNETLAYLKDIKVIEINGQSYSDINENPTEHYTFSLDESEYTINFSRPSDTLRVNKIVILTKSYADYSVDVENPYYEPYGNMFRILTSKEMTVGDDLAKAQCIAINIAYGVDDAVFNRAFREDIVSTSIDGKEYPKYCESDGKSFLTPFNKQLLIFDKYKEGKEALERYRLSDKHELIIKFSDGSQIMKRDEGYVEPSVPEPGTPEEPEDPGDIQFDNMAGDLKCVQIVGIQGVGQAIKLQSKLPKSKWYDTFYKNIRYVVIDDKEIIDKNENPGDIKLVDGNLVVATFTQIKDGTHDVKIYFADKSFAEYKPGMYTQPENPVNPFDKPQEPEGDFGKNFTIKDMYFIKEYGTDTFKVEFENCDSSKFSSNIDKAKIVINGKSFKSSIFVFSGWRSTLYTSDENVLDIIKKGGNVDFNIVWEDKSKTSFSKNIEIPKSNEFFPIANYFVVKENHKLILKIKFNKFDKTEVEKQIKEFRVNGKVFDISVLNFGNLITEVSDDGVISELVNKPDSKIEIEWKDGSVSSKSENLDIPDISNDKPVSQKDANTGIEVDYYSSDFDTDVELKVETVDPNAENISDKITDLDSLRKIKKNIELYDISFVKDEKQKTPASEVTVKIPVGIHDTDMQYFAVYHVNEEKTRDQISSVKIEDGFITFKTKELSLFVVASGDANEKPLTPGNLATDIGIDKVVLRDNGTELSIYISDYNNKIKVYKKSVLNALSKAEYRINGVDFKNITESGVRIYPSYEALSVSNCSALIKAYNRKPDGYIGITFEDGTHWDNGKPDVEVPANEFELGEKLSDGDYTLTYKAINRETGKKSSFAGYFSNKVHLKAENGVYTLTFLGNNFAKNILDFSVQSDNKFADAKIEPYKGLKNKKIFTMPVNKLDETHLGAVLVGIDGIQDSDIKDYTKYKTFDIEFEGPVKKGWDDFEKDQDAEQLKKENDKNLYLKLTSAGVKDANNNGILEPEELMKAEGTLNLTNEIYPATPDISMLKDLGPGVNTLYLNGNQIESIPEGLFDNMTNLTVLYIAGNKLSSLPEDIFKNNSNLLELDLASNSIQNLSSKTFEPLKELNILDLSSSGYQSLPEDLLKYNSNLQEIYLYDNELKTIPENFFADKRYLRDVHLNGNMLTKLPASLSGCKRLNKLWAYENKITEIPEGLTNLRHLCNIDLSNNLISKVPEKFWVQISTNVKNHGDTESKLDISNNLISDIPFEKMAKAGSKKFVKIDVSRNLLRSDIDDKYKQVLESAGIVLSNESKNFYQPQKTVIDAKATAAKGKIVLTQDLDMVEAGIWITTEGVNETPLFLTKEDFRNFFDNTLKVKYNIRTENRNRAAAEVLDAQGFDWKIRTVITKNTDEGGKVIYNRYADNTVHKGKTGDIDPVDGQKLEFDDPDMKKGDEYTLTRVIMTKAGASPFKNTLTYAVNFSATEDALSGSEAVEMPFVIRKAAGEGISGASGAFEPSAQVRQIGDKWQVTLTAKAMSMGNSPVKGHVEKFYLYDNKDAMLSAKPEDRRAVTVVSKYTDAGKEYPEKIQFTLNEKPAQVYAGAYVDIMGRDVEMIFDFTGSQPPSTATSWKVPLKVENHDKGGVSMADGCLGKYVTVKKVEGGYDYIFETPIFNIAGMNIESWLTNIKMFRSENRYKVKDATEHRILNKDGDRFTSIGVIFPDKEKRLVAEISANGMPMKDIPIFVSLDWDKATVEGSEPEEENKTLAEKHLARRIAEAELLLANGNKYTSASKSGLEKALAAGKLAIQAKVDADMEKAARDLERAMNALKIEGSSGGGSDNPNPVHRTVNAYLKHATKDRASMADKGMDHKVDVTEENGRATYTVYFKPIEVNGIKGDVNSIIVGGTAAEKVAGRGDYTQGFRFTRAAIGEKEIPLSFVVSVMPGEQEAILLIEPDSIPSGNGGGSGGSGGGASNPDKADLNKLIEKATELIKEKDKYDENAVEAIKKAIEAANKANTKSEIDNAKAELDKLVSELLLTTNNPTPLSNADIAGKAFTEKTVEAAFIKGYNDGTFKPDALITRAEAASILTNFVQANVASDKSFSDVKNGAWYKSAVENLISSKILSGYTDGTFKPENALTRAELVTIIARIKGLDTGKKTFADVSDNHWASNAIKACADAGYINGYEDGSFRPDKNISRAEFVVIINRVFGIKDKANVAKTFKDVAPDHWAYAEIMKAANN